MSARIREVLGGVILLMMAHCCRADVPGDANGDGSVTYQDVQLVSAHVLGLAPLAGSALSRADANGDRKVDVADLVKIQGGQLPPEKIFILPGGVPLVMVRIPRGSFQMGSVDPGWSSSSSTESPVHTVTIDYDLYMGKYEITSRQWVALEHYWPYRVPADVIIGRPDEHPISCVSWNNVQGFEASINTMGFGGTFRLPSEAEWEYAARGGTQTRYSFGDSSCAVTSCGSGDNCELDAYAWWCGNASWSQGDSGYGPQVVGQKLHNPFGLHDTMGNVWEWCEDTVQFNYEGAPTDGAAWVNPFENERVIRGGAWGARPAYLRPTIRGGAYQNGNYESSGFRIAWIPN